MTAPTEEGMAVAEIQKLDPEFVKVIIIIIILTIILKFLIV